MNTDYGRGFKTCLFQFVMHEKRLDQYLAEYRAGAGWKDENIVVTMWANGASDHLYKLITGGGVPEAIRSSAARLQTHALSCGHGSLGHKQWTEGDAREMLTLAHELLDYRGRPKTLVGAMRQDRELFRLNPDRGAWSCSKPIEK